MQLDFFSVRILFADDNEDVMQKNSTSRGRLKILDLPLEKKYYKISLLPFRLQMSLSLHFDS